MNILFPGLGLLASLILSLALVGPLYEQVAGATRAGTASGQSEAIIQTPRSPGAQGSTCDLNHYKGLPGLSVSIADNTLIVTWDGEMNNELRLRLAINDGTPTIRDLAIRPKGAQWVILASNLTPEFHVVTGFRRLPLEQIRPLMSAGIPLTPEIVEQNKWEAFWDAPLRIPGSAEGPGASSVLGWMPPGSSVGGLQGLPRTPDEINRASAAFQAQSCDVNTNGARVEISFPGVKLGVFSGKLQYTVYKGTNLIRQEVIAKTDEPSVAYKYDAGLKGIAIQAPSKLAWRDLTNSWQEYRFGSPVNDAPITLKTSNRLVAAEVPGGSI